MALSKSSILHYWDARYGPIPRIGGAPHHTRNSAASWIDGQGILQSAIVNTPRFEVATVGSEDRPVMRLEQARTNRFTYSEDLSNAAWVKSGVTISANAALAPDGTLTADKIVEDGTTAAHFVHQAITYTSATAQSGLVYAKAAGRTWLYLRLDLAAAKNSWVNLSDGTLGTVDAALTVKTQLLGNGWVEVAFSQNSGITGSAGEFVFGTATGNNDTSHAGDSASGIYVWGACHFRDAPSPSSYTKTTTAEVTRSADSFYWDYTPAPQGMVVYCCFIERGTIKTTGQRLWQITNAAGATPYVLVYNGGSFYQFYHDNGTSFVYKDLAVAPAIGDTVEIVTVLNAAGCSIAQSINGAAISEPSATGALALASAWASPTRLYMNSEIAGNVGINDFAALKIVKLADVVAGTGQGIMDELRAFEVNALGEVIVTG